MKAMPWAAAYHAAKGAVRIHTKVAAMEYAGDQIRVNSIHPGAIDTAMLTGCLFGGVPWRARLTASLSAGWERPWTLRRGALFLACDDSDYITGTELVIDGGILAQ